ITRRRWYVPRPSCESGERGVEIGDEIVGVLQPDRDPEQAFGSAGGGAFDRGPMLDQAFGPAQAGGPGEELEPRGQGQGSLPSSRHDDREHAAEGAHLARGDGVARIAGQAWIVDPLHLSVVGQEPGYSHRAIALDAKAGGHGPNAAKDEPAVEWG